MAITGYASLIHLRRLPLTFVKIDGSFVQGLGTDQEDERIVFAVVDPAANLGLCSIAKASKRSISSTACASSAATTRRDTSSCGRCW
jgi:predicted signal transduction protein with EAL and GGDEF domain